MRAWNLVESDSMKFGMKLFCKFIRKETCQISTNFGGWEVARIHVETKWMKLRQNETYGFWGLTFLSRVKFSTKLFCKK